MNINSFRRLAILCFLLINIASVKAAIIDHGTYTTDTVSGLDWLDVSISANQSYDYVSSQFGVGGEYEGYRYATGIELANLVTNAGSTDTQSSTGLTELVEVNNDSAADLLIELLGSTLYTLYLSDPLQTLASYPNYTVGGSYDWIRGITADFNGAMVIVGDIEDIDNGAMDTGDQVLPHHYVYTTNTQRYDTGSFLVRDSSLVTISEPSILMLMSFGLIGFFVITKKN